MSVLFVLSGAAGLAYEVIWFKRFSLVWGNSSLAAAAVVASFLLGLGLGARYIGPLADRVRSPLFWYGLAELVIGFLAVALPWETERLVPLVSIISPDAENRAVILWLARLALTILVIGPPCVLMGGTLPLLLKAFAAAGKRTENAIAWIYAVNTLGAAAGCFLTGFYLLPHFGLSLTNSLTAALNVAVGIVAMLVARRIQALPEATAAGSDLRSETGAPVAAESRAGQSVPFSLLCAVGFLVGCAALILQIVWTRQLALILGGSTYAFASMLFVILLGVGLGSLLQHFWLSSARFNLLQVFAGSLLLLVLATIVGKQLIIPLTKLVGAAVSWRTSDGINALICVGVSVCLEFIPAISMGILLPILVHLAKASSGFMGRTAGRIYASNTLGTIVGALGASMLLLPQAGAIPATVIALILYLLALFTLLSAQPVRLHRTAWGCGVAGILAIPALGGRVDPLLADQGLYMYGYPNKEVAVANLLYFREGAMGNVLVTSVGKNRALRFNGKIDATTTVDMGMQLGIAYFPKLLRPEARDVFIVGFGSGTTAGASTLFPGARITCCELEPAVFAAAEFFNKVNHTPQTRDNFKILFEDGRSYLQAASKKYDLILSEPSNPWVAGVCNLFTQEFYETARKRLNRGGIFAQWIQLYSFSLEDYALVIRTVTSVFPHYGLIRISDVDTMLVASETDFEDFKDKLSPAQSLADSLAPVRDDFQKYYGTTKVSALMLTHYVLDKKGVEQFLSKVPGERVITDRNLRLEFDTPLKIFERRDDRKEINTALFSCVQTNWLRTLFGQSADWHPDTVHALVQMLDSYHAKDMARECTRLGRAILPDEPKLLADEILLSDGNANLEENKVRTLAKSSVEEANRAGTSLLKAKRFKQAVAIFRAVVEEKPSAASAWANLAVASAAVDDAPRAEEAFRRALALDPASEFVRDAHGKFRAKRAGKPEASHEIEKRTSQGE